MLWTLALLVVAAPDSSFRADRSRAAVDVAVFSTRDTTAVHPTVAARAVLGPAWAFEAELPFAVRLEPSGTSVVGNPSAAVFARGHLGGVGRVELGLRLWAPFARDANGRDVETLDLATAMSGYFALASYRPDTLSVAVPLRFESTSAQGLAFWGEGRPVLAVPTDGGELAGLAFLTLGGGYRTRRAEARVEFGLAALVLPELPADVEGQLFVQPGLRFDVWRTRRSIGFLSVDLRIHLDEPAGFSFDGGVYTVAVRAGVELPAFGWTPPEAAATFERT